MIIIHNYCILLFSIMKFEKNNNKYIKIYKRIFYNKNYINIVYILYYINGD
jgi:hypothetical protein